MRIYIIDYIGFTLGITEGNIYKYHYLVLFMEKSLNENDRKLLAICSKESSIGEIAKQLNISPKNVSVRLKKLLDLKSSATPCLIFEKGIFTSCLLTAIALRILVNISDIGSVEVILTNSLSLRLGVLP